MLSLGSANASARAKRFGRRAVWRSFKRFHAVFGESGDIKAL